MYFGDIHILDIAVIVAYLAVVIVLGFRESKKVTGEEGFFLAGRSLGRVYQFFLNFGNATDANGAVSTVSLVYRQGVSGIWLGFQLVFVNPYYWFMNVWFRRVRLVTMADLFTDRLGSRGLATFYSLFQIMIAVFVIIGFGNLVTYKISSALIVKSESAWTVEDRSAIEGYQELNALVKTSATTPLDEPSHARLNELRERQASGELKSFISALRPVPFYIGYTLVVGVYVILGGMAATAVNEVIQSLIIIVFSVLLIPVGFAAIGGAGELAERVPMEAFNLFSSQGDGQINIYSLLAVLLVAVIQINGIIGNMGIAGSATNERAARYGAVSGTYAKRVMFVLWAFTGLIAVALFQGPTALSDPDLAWGTMSRELLGPGLLGLMLTGVLAANMSTVAAQTVSASALFVRNLFQPIFPNRGEKTALLVGRFAMVGALGFGVVAASMMTSVFSALVLVQTVAVPLGATVWLMFFWRRLTVPGAWAGILLATALNIVGPFTVSQIDAIKVHPTLTARVDGVDGTPLPVYFETVAREDPADPDSPLVGSGRLHLELVVVKLLGINPAQMSNAGRFGMRFLVDAITPFIFLIGVSLLTRPPKRELIDQFYGRMKTPVGATRELEAAGIAATRAEPDRFDHTKLVRNSNWEFTKWDREDTIGFFACCAISCSIVGVFWGLLRLASG
jgi:SSS family solute:Na+ symporter